MQINIATSKQRVFRLLLTVALACMMVPAGAFAQVADQDTAKAELSADESAALVFSQEMKSDATDLNPQAAQADDSAEAIAAPDEEAGVVQPADEKEVSVEAASDAAVASEGEVALQDDLTNRFTITEWGIYDSQATASKLDTSTHYVGGDHPFTHKLKFKWTLQNGPAIHDGDTVTLPVPTATTPVATIPVSINMQNGDWQNFTLTTGPTVMGQWRVYNSHIELKFGPNSEGLATMSGIEFQTGDNAVDFYYQSTKDITATISFGGSTATQAVLLKGAPYVPGGSIPVNKGLGFASNSEINWWTRAAYDMQANESLSSGLAVGGLNGWGKIDSYYKSLYFEDEGPDVKAKFINVVLYACMSGPVAVDGLTDAQWATVQPAANFSSIIGITANTLFTEVTPTTGQSYDQFKQSLKPRQYGFYVDSAGKSKFVMYFGDMNYDPADQNCCNLRYEDIDPNWVATSVQQYIDAGGCYDTPANRARLTQWFSTAYGNSNTVHGNISGLNIHFSTVHDKVVYDTKKYNTAGITFTGGTSSSPQAEGTLQGIKGSVVVDRGCARCYKIEDDGNATLIAGATIKLQKQNGTTWDDYTAEGASKQTGAIGSPTEGYVEYGTLANPLPDGTYRFVETAAAPGYSLETSPGYDAAAGGVVSDTFVMAAIQLEGQKVTITNSKTPPAPTPVDYTVPTVTKSVISATTAPAETFEFKIAPAVATQPMPAAATITRTGAGAVAFDKIHFTEAGTYTYTITETNKGTANWTYDTASYTLVVTVAAQNGALVANGVITKNGTAATGIAFTNTYTAPVPPAPTPVDYAVPAVTKAVTSATTAPAETFTFKIAGENNAPMPAADTATVTGAGTASFGKINYATAGTYTYTITETAGTATGWTYDTAAYKLVVTVTNTNGALVATGAISKDGAPANDIMFTNTYTVPVPPVPLNPEVSKVADKTTANPGDMVTYTITVENPTDAAMTGVWVKDILPEGTEFVSCDQAGTYGESNGKHYVNWFLKSVAAHETVSFTVQLRMAETVAAGTKVTNQALYTLTGTEDEPDFTTDPQGGQTPPTATTEIKAKDPVVNPVTPSATTPAKAGSVTPSSTTAKTADGLRAAAPWLAGAMVCAGLALLLARRKCESE